MSNTGAYLKIQSDRPSPNRAKFAHRNGASVGDRDETLRKACRDFEAVFLRQMLKTMRSSGGWDGVLKEGHGEAIFTSQRDAALAEEMSKRGALGISQMLYNQMQDLHDHRTHPPQQVDQNG